MMTTLILAAALAVPEVFTDWPTGSEPETIGRRVVEQFLSAPPEAYAPKGANAYHSEGKVVPYAIVSLWAQLVDEPEVWSETSGSAMFASAFVTGVKLGWLDAAEYGPAARRAYLGLLKHLDAYGNIDETCMGTGTHDDHEFYLKRPRKIGDAHGQAALMWTINAFLAK